MVRKRILEELLTCMLRVVDIPDEIDGGLIGGYIPQLLRDIYFRHPKKKEKKEKKRTPSQANIRNSSSSQSSVSVV